MVFVASAAIRKLKENVQATTEHIQGEVAIVGVRLTYAKCIDGEHHKFADTTIAYGTVVVVEKMTT